MSEIEDKNIRQLNLMKSKIDMFFDDQILLKYLINDLKSIFWAMEKTSESWGEDFLSEWGALETVYALELNRREQGVPPPGENNEEIPSWHSFVKVTVGKIRDLVEQEITRLASDPELN